MTKALFDLQKRPVRLGQVLGKGGEGSVFLVEGRPDAVAKIYHKPVVPDKADKLRVMASQNNDALRSLTAWPVDVVADQAGHISGFIMPNVSGFKDIHHLYSPKSRKTEFPEADFRFILRSATNVARAFATIHSSGTVIGDVNHGGIRVAQKSATVKLIDCDSFQIADKGRHFLCEVGVPIFTPPELQSKPFKGVVRTPNHDNFGLAVLVFHLVYMGRHPFAGRPLGKEDVPIEKAISEYRFPYSGDQGRTRMEPPPNTLALNQMGDHVATLFMRAFGASGSAANGRPRAEEWVNTLAALESNLKKCGSSATHHYPGHLSNCPWCEFEKKVGLVLFGFSGGSQPGGAINISGLAARLAAIQSPGRSDLADNHSPKPSEPSDDVKDSGFNRALMRFLGAGVLALGFFLVLFLGIAWAWLPCAIAAGTLFVKSSKSKAMESANGRKSSAMADLNSLRDDWKNKASENLFTTKKNDVQSQLSLLGNINIYRQNLIKELDNTRQRRQLEQFLDSVNIEDSKIPGIGPSRAAVLASYNIETALDVVEHRVWSVPGFGKKRVGDLMKWRRQVETRFVYRPNQPHSAADLADVERKVNQKRIELERSVSSGLIALEQLRISILRERQRLTPLAAEALRRLSQAEADIAFLNK